MTKSKSVVKGGTPPTTNDAVEKLVALESSLNLSPGMTLSERKEQKSLSRNVPDKLIELVAEVATQNGGSVAGIPFDAAEASATLTYTSNAEKTAEAAKGLAQRVTDDAVQRRTSVANSAFAIYRAMGRLVRTTKGQAYRQKYEEMQRLVRKTRSTAADDTTQTATPAATNAASGATETPQATTTTPQASTTPAAH